MRVLVTGSSGLVGSEAVLYFDALGADVVGLDHTMLVEELGGGEIPLKQILSAIIDAWKSRA